MHISRCELQDGSCNEEGNRCKDNGVLVEIEADANIKSVDRKSLAKYNSCFCPIIKENGEREEADEKG